MREVSPEMAEALADRIVAGMTMEELQQAVFDDLYDSMLSDPELFESNLEMEGVTVEELMKDESLNTVGCPSGWDSIES